MPSGLSQKHRRLWFALPTAALHAPKDAQPINVLERVTLGGVILLRIKP